MDRIDKAILRVMQRNADASVEEIGGEVGLSHTPVWRRIRRLEADGVILGRYCKLDRKRLGLEVVMMASIKLGRLDETGLVEFEEAVRGIPEILDCYSMTGSFDYLLKIVTSSVEDYEQLLKKKISHLPHLQGVTSALVLREVKQSEMLPI